MSTKTEVAAAMGNAVAAIAAGEDYTPLPAAQEVQPAAPAAQEVQPAAPASAAQPNWAAQLAALTRPAVASGAMGDTWAESTVLQQITDKTAADQDAKLAAMFGQENVTQRRDTSNLPRAIDSYLDRILK